MGLLDQIVSSLGHAQGAGPATDADANADGVAAAGAGGVAGVLVGLLGHEEGGLGALVQKFNDAGAGNLISSWIGNGPNAAVAPEQLQGILGSGLVQQLAAKTGLPVQDLLGQLSQHMPAVVDGMTPNGQVPPNNQLLAMGMSFLKSRMG
jgi:uncharacterized protein YidB (DUF937 family)